MFNLNFFTSNLSENDLFFFSHNHQFDLRGCWFNGSGRKRKMKKKESKNQSQISKTCDSYNYQLTCTSKCKHEWWIAVLGIASLDMCMLSNFGESAYGTVFIIQLWSRVIYYVVQKGSAPRRHPPPKTIIVHNEIDDSTVWLLPSNSMPNSTKRKGSEQNFDCVRWN